jgi:hypothetical protein
LRSCHSVIPVPGNCAVLKTFTYYFSSINSKRFIYTGIQFRTLIFRDEGNQCNREIKINKFLRCLKSKGNCKKRSCGSGLKSELLKNFFASFFSQLATGKRIIVTWYVPLGRDRGSTLGKKNCPLYKAYSIGYWVCLRFKTVCLRLIISSSLTF